jgi:hypothetical protein
VGVTLFGYRWVGSNEAAEVRKGESSRLETVENPLGAIFISWKDGAPEAAGSHVSPSGKWPSWAWERRRRAHLARKVQSGLH